MYKYILIISTFFLLNSCDLDLDPQGTPVEEEFYTNINALETGANALYSHIRSNSFIRSEWVFGEACGDECIVKDGLNLDERNLALFNFSSDNSAIIERWEQNYQGIYKANIIIHYAPEFYSSDSDQEQAALLQCNQLVSEAKFFRAYFYFNLVKAFGGVPIKPEHLYLNEDGSNNFYQARSTKEQVYQYIEQDLREAIIGLDKIDREVKTKLGKATKGAAVGLLVKVLAYQAETGISDQKWQEVIDFSELLLTSDKTMTVNELLSYNADYDYDSLAYRLCLETIDLSSSVEQIYSNYGLFSDYHLLWRPENEFNKESLFEVNNVYINSSAIYLGSEFNSELTASLEPLIKHSELGESYYKDLPKDVRWSLTYNNTGQYPDGVGSAGNGSRNTCYKWYAWDDDNKASTNQPHNYKIMRIAEVMLFYAEALNELGRGEEAIAQLNIIRTRARAMNEQNSLSAFKTPGEPGEISNSMYETNKEIIWRERRYELLAENDRFWEIVRQGKADECFTIFNQHTKVISSPSLAKSFIKGVNELFPIPQQEILLSNGKMEQNPGY